MLGPILFVIDMLPLGQLPGVIIIHFHFYGNDAWVYIETIREPITDLIELNSCLEEIRAWMSTNLLAFFLLASLAGLPPLPVGAALACDTVLCEASALMRGRHR